jgi:hypothetical protein
VQDMQDMQEVVGPEVRFGALESSPRSWRWMTTARGVSDVGETSEQVNGGCGQWPGRDRTGREDLEGKEGGRVVDSSLLALTTTANRLQQSRLLRCTSCHATPRRLRICSYWQAAACVRCAALRGLRRRLSKAECAVRRADWLPVVRQGFSCTGAVG